MAEEAKPVHLPVGPTVRRLPDGRIIRVIAHNRHLIRLPRQTYPATSWKATCDMGRIFGHPEIAIGMDRIEALLCRANDLTEREIMRLKMLEAVLPVVIEPVRQAIAARWPADFLLPCFGNFPTHGEVVRDFKMRGGRGEVYQAIGFFYVAMMTVDLIEARLAASKQTQGFSASGNVAYEFRGDE